LAANRCISIAQAHPLGAVAPTLPQFDPKQIVGIELLYLPANNDLSEIRCHVPTSVALLPDIDDCDLASIKWTFPKGEAIGEGFVVTDRFVVSLLF
jgi:hypothetical protein